MFDAAGGFDERYAEPSIEDIELGARLTGAGHAIRLEKGLQVKHLKRWGLSDMLATDLWRRAVPWTQLMLADGRLVNDLNVKTRDRASVATAWLALAALAGAWRWPAMLALAAAALGVIVVLNRGLFGLFRRRHGWTFALRAVPFYWVFLAVSGIGFAIGLGRHLAGRVR